MDASLFSSPANSFKAPGMWSYDGAANTECKIPCFDDNVEFPASDSSFSITIPKDTFVTKVTIGSVCSEQGLERVYSRL